MIKISVYFENGDSLITGINATFAEAKEYYVGKEFNLGNSEDNLQKCTQIELIS